MEPSRRQRGPARRRCAQAALLLAVAALPAVLPGCSLRTMRRELVEPTDLSRLETLDGEPPFLKAHLRDGSVWVLSEWEVDEPQRLVTGRGRRFDAARDLVASGPATVPVDSVTIFEANVLGTSSIVYAFTVLSVATVAATVYCIANPKSCYGSCPTFYAPGEDGLSLQAEGFSASVAPALEATDLDALHRCRPSGRRLELEMRNEALETHVVRRADLLVAERPPGGRVLATGDGRLLRATRLVPLRRATAEEGDCTDLLAAPDGRERCSLADSLDLAAREIVELEFAAAPAGSVGLALGSRQGLLSTFLFYQTLAYLGERAAPLLGRLEGSAAGPSIGSPVGELLGRIEVLVPDGDAWRPVGEVGETGPLAGNLHLLPLPPLDPQRPVVRLRLTRGHYRLDWAALAVLDGEARARRVPPREVRRDGEPDPEALACLLDPERTLVTQPGDVRTLVYDLPAAPDRCELFLESRGYYLEWMRREWLPEQDPAAAALVLADPAEALRRLAPAYKALEPDMEAQFWGSRYARPR